MKKLHERLINDRNKHAIISDVRLKEEQEWLTVHTNPVWIKIVRKVEKDHNSEHRTEKEVSKLGYDVLIENNGSKEALYKKLDKLIDKIQ